MSDAVANGRWGRVRASRAIVIALPVVLTGCPGLLSDWKISGKSTVDAGAGAQANSGGDSGGNSGASSGGNNAGGADASVGGTGLGSGGSSGAGSGAGSGGESGPSTGGSSNGMDSGPGAPDADGAPNEGGVTAPPCRPSGNCTSAVQCCSHSCDQYNYRCN